MFGVTHWVARERALAHESPPSKSGTKIDPVFSVQLAKAPSYWVSPMTSGESIALATQVSNEWVSLVVSVPAQPPTQTSSSCLQLRQAQQGTPGPLPCCRKDIGVNVVLVLSSNKRFLRDRVLGARGNLPTEKIESTRVLRSAQAYVAYLVAHVVEKPPNISIGLVLEAVNKRANVNKRRCLREVAGSPFALLVEELARDGPEAAAGQPRVACEAQARQSMRDQARRRRRKHLVRCRTRRRRRTRA